jgi:carbon storage regulator
MLILSRGHGEQIAIGNDIVITVVQTGPKWCRLGIDAPRDVPIVRTELLNRETYETTNKGKS